jgi:ATP-dependent Clp protease ATP-binding subunit ClpA
MLAEGLEATAERVLAYASALAGDAGDPTVGSDVVLFALAAQDPARPLLARLRGSLAERHEAGEAARPAEPPYDQEVFDALAQAWRFALLLAAERPTADHLLLGLLSERSSRSAQAARAAGFAFEDAFHELTGWDRAPTGFAPPPFEPPALSYAPQPEPQPPPA